MNVSSLQRLTILSFIFHVTFFGVVFLALKQSSRFVMPSSYVVNLVESDIKSEEASGTQVVSKAPEPETLTVPKKEEAVSPSPKEARKLKEKEEEQLKNTMAALDAKRRIKSKAELKRKMDNIHPLKGSAVQARAVGSTTTSGSRGGAVVSNYIAGITGAIQRQYEITPDIAGKNLVAKVFMRIMKDGSVQGARITNRSGNLTFDRCVLRAIAKASPVSPPPDGENMEVEVTFRL